MSALRKAPSQQRSRLTVEAILDAAAQVFEQHGYAAGTTNRIAERAGVSIGSLYQYFPNKDAILVALTERHIHEGTQVIRPLLARLDERMPLEQALSDLVRAMVELHRQRPALHRVLVEEAPRPPQLRARFDALFEAATRAVAGFLRTNPEAVVDDAELAARMVIQIIESITHNLVIHPATAATADQVADQTVLVLSRYLRPGPRP